MNFLKKALFRFWLPRLLSKSCPEIIPRSGDKGKAINCFSVSFDNGEEPYILVTDIVKNELECLQWNGSRYEDHAVVNLNDLGKHKFFVRHYWHLSDIKYSSIYRLTFNRLTGLVYALLLLRITINHFSHYFFIKKRFVTKKRLELLQFLIDLNITTADTKVDSMSLMSRLYSIRWILHPSGEQQKSMVDLYLESLVKSGDIIELDNKYYVSGKALSTIEEYEKEESRHIDSVKMRKKMFWLTVVVTIFTFFQLGIVKLPVLFDFSEFPPIVQIEKNEDK